MSTKVKGRAKSFLDDVVAVVVNTTQGFHVECHLGDEVSHALVSDGLTFAYEKQLETKGNTYAKWSTLRMALRRSGTYKRQGLIGGKDGVVLLDDLEHV